jgi:hypothetical protein
MERVPAISIRQPWAELILSGRKTIEIRSWSTEHHGLLWVHTGLKGIPELESEMGFSDLFKGGYIGSVVLDTVIPLDRHRWEVLDSRHLCSRGDYVPGQYGWVLSSPYKFEQPIPGPGQRGLFYPTTELGELLHRANSPNKDIKVMVSS